MKTKVHLALIEEIRLNKIEKVARIIYEGYYHQVEGFSGDPYFGSKEGLWKNWVSTAETIIKEINNE